MAQLAINVSLSKAKANYTCHVERSRLPSRSFMRRLETSREFTGTLRDGVPPAFASSYGVAGDFARNDTMKISGKFRMRCIQVN